MAFHPGRVPPIIEPGWPPPFGRPPTAEEQQRADDEYFRDHVERIREALKDYRVLQCGDKVEMCCFNKLEADGMLPLLTDEEKTKVQFRWHCAPVESAS